MVALIPAKGESRGYPRKLWEKLEVGGGTLLDRTIEFALGMGLEPIVMTTNDDLRNHAERQAVMCVRCETKSGGVGGAFTDMYHSAALHKREPWPVDEPFVLLQPDTPLRTEATVRELIRRYEVMAQMWDVEPVIQGAEPIGRRQCAVVSAYHAPWPNEWNVKTDPMGRISSGPVPDERQDCEVRWRLCAVGLVSTARYVIANRGWYGNQTYLAIVPEDEAIDIDHPRDMWYARHLLAERVVQQDQAEVHRQWDTTSSRSGRSPEMGAGGGEYVDPKSERITLADAAKRPFNPPIDSINHALPTTWPIAEGEGKTRRERAEDRAAKLNDESVLRQAGDDFTETYLKESQKLIRDAVERMADAPFEVDINASPTNPQGLRYWSTDAIQAREM